MRMFDLWIRMLHWRHLFVIEYRLIDGTMYPMPGSYSSSGFLSSSLLFSSLFFRGRCCD